MAHRQYRSRQAGGADDSLFGSSSSKGPPRGRIPANSVVISRGELDRIKHVSKIRTAADVQREREEVEAAQEEKHRQARARKERMLKLEESAKAKARKSDMELDREARKGAVRAMADKALDENLDLVKMLNTLGARAAAFTIRDQQLEEKQHLDAKKREYEERMDVLMEIDRLTDLRKRDSIETHRRLKRVEDRKVIVEQIQARTKKKLLEEELLEQENQGMLALVAKYKREDYEQEVKHREEVVLARQEVMAANEAAIRRKELAKQREREEEESILLYQARKDDALRAREAEEREREAAMKERQAKLLAMQEKTQNKQAEVDELRARRYAEERERRERERELSEAETKAKRMAELQDARMNQAEQKKRMMAREAVMQHAEYEESLRHANDIIERERKEADDRAGRAKEHREVLQKQIMKSEEAKHLKMKAKLEEGRKLKSEFAQERAKLEAIRDKMVDDMERKGYNPRYLSEIRAADIQKLQMR